MNDQIQQLMSNLPAWAREPAVLIGAGVVLALLLLWLLSRLFRSRPRDEEYVEPVQVEEYPPVVRPISPPPVSPPPPPLAEEPPVIVVQEAVPAPEPEPAAAEPVPEPEPMPEPYSPYVAEEAPEPAIADEPIAAAAPFDASPASIAADVPVSEPEPEPEPVEAPVAASEPAPAPAAPDDLTRMKGVGPRLADRLASVGITRFTQLAALTPEDADALDAKLGDFQGRIHRDRWIEQAGYLASDDIAGFEATFGKL